VPRRTLRLAQALALVSVPFSLAYLVTRVVTMPAGVGPWILWAGEVIFAAFAWVTVAVLTRFHYRPPPPARPFGSLDVVIPTCGEPLDLLSETISAAVAIPYPHRTVVLNDWYVAGKPGAEKVAPLANALGAECIDRHDGPRLKSANLNHGLAHLDADYRAYPDAAELLGYFAEPDVGFVGTPQVVHVDGPDVMGVRETVFHLTFQRCRDADGVSTSPGSGVAYRRAALDAVGGFDEKSVFEDFAISVAMHLSGWRSVYHGRPIALGTAPPTAAGVTRQRLRWATGMFTTLRQTMPLGRTGPTFWTRVHYLQNAGAYPTAAIGFALLLVGLTVTVLFNRTNPVPLSIPLAVAFVGFVGANLVSVALVAGPFAAVRTVSQSSFFAFTYMVGLFRSFRPPLVFEVAARPGQRTRSWLVLPSWAIFAAQLTALATVAAGRSTADAFAAFTFILAFLLVGPLSAVSVDWRINRIVRNAIRGAMALGLIVFLASKL
jgi:cellulose synthase/poly-beta-1,6-N-acetylglucosamine synthase-like glycosyltransferase